ncbi:p23 chaperone protein wos2 [Coemansia sp. RSA 2671]|nr:p23 chaperone protein wos2 [Coemansia sp. RSA 2671]
MSSTVHHPRVLWAQRKDVVYLTIELEDAPEATFTDESIDFACVKDDKKYAFHLDFYKPIVVKKTIKSDSKRVSFYILKKADDTVWWERLCKEKGKVNFVHTDFSRFVDEDESEDEKPAHPGMDFSQLGMGGMPGMGGMGGMPGMGGMGGMPDFSAMGGMPGMGGMGGMPDFSAMGGMPGLDSGDHDADHEDGPDDDEE